MNEHVRISLNLSAVLAFIIAAGVVCVVPAAAQNRPAPDDNVRAAIEDVARAWMTAYNEGDPSAVAALYTDDARIMPPNLPTISGRAGIEQFYQGIEGSGVQSTIDVYEVEGHDSTAHALGQVEVTRDGTHLDHAHWMGVFKKRGDQWKIQRLMWGSEMPPAAGEAGPAQVGIQAANDRFMQAVAAGDAAAVAALYTDDAMLMPPNHAPVTGRAAIETYWQGGFDAGMKGLDLTTTELVGLGDTMYETGTAVVHGPGGQTLDTGKYVVVWRNVDGDWRLHRDIWNSDVPPPGDMDADQE